jgi:hypothetical protein
VLYGTAQGLNEVGNQILDRNNAQVPGGLQGGARFGDTVK